jgi:hypothetical protein
MIRRDATGEFLVCDCGNDVMSDGFYPVEPHSGLLVEPTPLEWDGVSWQCGKCKVVQAVSL